MGWLYTQHQTKEQLIDRCLNGEAHPSSYTAIEHSLSGNHLWVVFERNADVADHWEYDGRTYPRPARFIGLYLLASQRDYGWGYKDMDESMGPYEVDCPLRFLGMVPDPGGYATKWRAKVQEFHRQKGDKRALIKSLRPGMRVKLVDGCRPSEITVVTVTPKLVGVSAEGVRYRVQPRHVEQIVGVQ